MLTFGSKERKENYIVTLMEFSGLNFKKLVDTNKIIAFPALGPPKISAAPLALKMALSIT